MFYRRAAKRSVAPAVVTPHLGFLQVEVGGSPYDRGWQHGQALAEQITTLRDRLQSDIIFRRGRALGTGFSAVLYGLLARMYPHIPRELRDEMRGVADGASVRYRDVLLINCFDDVLHGLMQVGPVLQPIVNHRFVAPILGRFACSSFVIAAERSATGGTIHGRNLDYVVSDEFLDPEWMVPRSLREHVILLITRPDRGLPFGSVTWPGFVGVTTGMNARGISLACLTSTVSRERVSGIPLPLLYRLVAQHATTLDEAEWLLRGARRTIGNNLTVASGSEGSGRLFEISMDHVAVHQPTAGVVRTTNHFQTSHPMNAQEGYVVPNSIYRLDRLGELFARGTFTVADACAALTDVCPGDPDQWQWDCLQNPGTIYSTVFEPSAGRIWLRANDLPSRDFVMLDLADKLATGATARAA